jgi:hypothetical protein
LFFSACAPAVQECAVAITNDFSLALAGLGSTGPAEPELLPNRLAAACTAVLPVDGAGICLFDSTGIRIPVGASDRRAAIAERLQFTAAQGPCLDAHSLGCSLIATESLIAQEWPMYYDSLVSRTPFRAVIAVPLTGALTGIGTIDLYFHQSRGVADLNMIDTEQVVTQISGLLAQDPVFGVVADGPAWLDDPAAEARSAVFIAMGLLNIALDVTTHDALTLMRARAYATDRSVDDVAADLVHHRMPTEEFRLDHDA